MNVIILGYVAVFVLWVTLFVIHRQSPAVWHKAHRATWWLLGASIIIAIAWFIDSIILSFVGMLFALTCVSFIFQVLTDWLKKKKVHKASYIIWFEWLFVFAVTLAHVMVWSMNTLYEATH